MSSALACRVCGLCTRQCLFGRRVFLQGRSTGYSCLVEDICRYESCRPQQLLGWLPLNGIYSPSILRAPAKKAVFVFPPATYHAQPMVLPSELLRSEAGAARHSN